MVDSEDEVTYEKDSTDKNNEAAGEQRADNGNNTESFKPYWSVIRI